MNINTGKLTSNSTPIIKETKKKDSATKSSKIINLKEDKISNKLLKDFPEIVTDNKSYKNIEMQIDNAKNEIEKIFTQLQNEFKAIEITSQNIISQYSYPMNIGENTIKNLNLEELVKSTEVNNKRVMD